LSPKIDVVTLGRWTRSTEVKSLRGVRDTCLLTKLALHDIKDYIKEPLLFVLLVI